MLTPRQKAPSDLSIFELSKVIIVKNLTNVLNVPRTFLMTLWSRGQLGTMESVSSDICSMVLKSPISLLADHCHV